MRPTSEELDGAALRAALEVLTDLGLDPVADAARLLITVGLDGHTVDFAVAGASVVDATRAVALTRRPTPAPAATTPVPLVVGDRLLTPARAVLEDHGWSWIDRRGGCHLRGPGLLVHAATAPRPRPTRRRQAVDLLGARGTQEVAVALLLDPDEPPVLREIARRTSLAPSTVSRSVAGLRAAGLVRSDGRAVVPDLFWALAERWPSERRGLATLPAPVAAPEPVAGRAPESGTATTVVLGDTRAALAWGAPLIASAAAPPLLYVADERTRQRMLTRQGEVVGAGASAWVAVAPVRSLLERAKVRPGETWPVVHPLFAALDLAGDRARGHQILDEWDPQEFGRVW